MPAKNTAETGGARSQRPVGGARWAKGHSGNPKGRPRGVANRVTRDIRAMAQALTFGDPKFVATLQRQLRTGACHPSIVQTLLAYGYGKPVERIENVGLDVDLVRLLDRIWEEDQAAKRAGTFRQLPPPPSDPRWRHMAERASVPTG